MNRAEILTTAKTCVCGGRDSDYGTPEDNFKTISILWNDYLKAVFPTCDINLAEKDVAIMMALLKIARITTSNNIDNFVDLAGYAACAGEVVAASEQ